MPFLGFDASRLTRLRQRVGDVADEAADLRGADPAAESGLTAYRRAAGRLTVWAPTLADIQACRAFGAYTPVAADPADPALFDVLHPANTHWAQVTDPLAVGPGPDDDRARHLAEFLTHADIGAVLDDAERSAGLTREVRLCIGEPSRRDGLLAALGPDRFAGVADDLAARVAAGGWSDQATRHADGADAVLAGLASVLGNAWRAGALDRPAWEGALLDADPFAVALVARHARLPSPDLARIAGRAWRQWAATPFDGVDERSAAPVGTSHVLLDALAADPVAGRLFLAAADPTDLGQVFGMEQHREVATRLLVEVTDPAVNPAEAMGPAMVNVLSFLDDHRQLVQPDQARWLGVVVGPYLEQLVVLDDAARYPASVWDWHGRDPEAILTWIARDDDSRAALALWADALAQVRGAEVVATVPVPEPALVHLGRVLGAADAAIAAGHIHEAEADADRFRDVWTLIGLPAGMGMSLLSAGSGVVLGTAVSRVTSYGVTQLSRMWRQQQWPGAPPDVAAVTARQKGWVGDRNASRVSAVLATAHAAGAHGAAPPPAYGGEGAAAYTRALNRWLLADGVGAAERERRRRLYALAIALDDGTCRASSWCDGQ